MEAVNEKVEETQVLGRMGKGVPTETPAPGLQISQVSNEVTSQERRNVVVTGFGPFQDLLTNASWEAVNLLKGMDIEKEIGINLITECIQVKYKTVEEKIPELWKKYDPLLMIHIGIRDCEKLTLEHCANRTGYILTDNEELVPESGSCQIGKDEIIRCTLDLNAISRKINSVEKIETAVSTEAGRYLCEYTYYASLCQDRSRCLFIHIPVVEEDDQIGIEEAANKICKIIKLLVEELRQDTSKCNYQCLERE